MLKELNSIANGLLGLHGYAADPTVAAAKQVEPAPQAAQEPSAKDRVPTKSAKACVRVVPVRSRCYFAW